MTIDSYRARVLALPEAIEAASPARREELSRIVVQRVVVRDRDLASIEWAPAVRPFVERQRECPQGARRPARCLMTTFWRGGWRERDASSVGSGPRANARGEERLR